MSGVWYPKLSKLKPSTKYTLTVTAKNAAGSEAKAKTQTTAALYGTATCINGENGVEIVTLGQYLRPSRRHEPVDRYLRPEAFEALAAEARAIGFPTVYAGVFVRSSYNAFEVFRSGSAH